MTLGVGFWRAAQWILAVPDPGDDIWLVPLYQDGEPVVLAVAARDGDDAIWTVAAAASKAGTALGTHTEIGPPRLLRAESERQLELAL